MKARCVLKMTIFLAEVHDQQAGTQDASASSDSNARTGNAPVIQQSSGDSLGTSETTGKDEESAPVPKIDEPKDPTKPHQDKSGAHTPTSIPAAAKRPHAQTSTDGVQAMASGVEEPPAKTAQVQRSSLRPRLNVSADKRSGTKEHLDHVQIPLLEMLNKEFSKFNVTLNESERVSVDTLSYYEQLNEFLPNASSADL
ncbi:hypothetical protein HPB49_013387 [Dermacentor silvarum]|uniref:Uncharacterized protein n=1 Tax=Dermacentor silvarum TaxID=543639 RepID=A0ACB8DD72_DERSI|nr:hypothetical protein HPB49_013387 [Dermacentor silvarum]